MLNEKDRTVETVVRFQPNYEHLHTGWGGLHVDWSAHFVEGRVGSGDAGRRALYQL